ncbi:ATP-binding cassette domain-containing protein, partial [Pantoea sp. SIMBA_079]|uniref:ATP-binding cassette domain-containing protein n=1 Tax=Pantoea sp. SIMBA_079 TaxID=3085817 RepID=UPI00399541D0
GGRTVLSARGLGKSFGGFHAVRNVDLDVEHARVHALIGPNGAGKTTTLGMATGLLRPDAGEVLIHGVDMWRQPLVAKAMIGVLSDGVRLFDRLTGQQLVEYAGLLSGMDRPTAQQ